MKLPRRKFLLTAMAAGALPAVSRVAVAQTPPKPASQKPARPLAERLADYADRLRYDDLDAATVERVKAHVIDA
ncbi:MAG: 2-methylcitrate dehydratase, partial [Bradyrhizobium sp.]|nr:2-methylcitrate dehydratase [Bradyrhizobium sp.]